MINLEQTPYRKNKFIKQINIKSMDIYENNGYDSRFEMLCGEKIENFINQMDHINIYLDEQKYYPDSPMIVDFYLEFLDKKIWVEVSRFVLKDNPEYHNKIKYKRKLILTRGDQFWFINNATEMNKFINYCKKLINKNK